MAWIYLLLAGVAEIGWMVGLKFSGGFARLWWSVATVVCMAISLGFLALAVRAIPMGTAYAIWTGVGAAGIALVGIFFFDEPGTLLRLACIGLIVAGMVGLRLASA
ncbi:MAG: multidrug efflux SMR transporter [Rhodospirillales bacterium]|nr:multidrug efflux SMR transporter [Rhodospirillales bacterium]